MKTYLTIIASLILLNSCALTAPEGERQLMNEIEADKYREKQRSVYVGKPILVKVRGYKQVYNGDIYDDHWVFVQIGREKLDIKDLTGK